MSQITKLVTSLTRTRAQKKFLNGIASIKKDYALHRKSLDAAHDHHGRPARIAASEAWLNDPSEANMEALIKTTATAPIVDSLNSELLHQVNCRAETQAALLFDDGLKVYDELYEAVEARAEAAVQRATEFSEAEGVAVDAQSLRESYIEKQAGIPKPIYAHDEHTKAQWIGRLAAAFGESFTG